jgi:hypothetical protein
MSNRRDRLSSVEQLLSRVRTVGDAVDSVIDLFNLQIDRAETENAPPNEGVEGDATARDLFLTLLPTFDQRILFLQMIRNKRFWPRIRTLVGSPPFSFLREQDDTVLRPAGIARKRSHMATADGDISSYTSFGSAQFLDASTRDYKVVGKASTDRGMAPGSVSITTRRNLELPFIGLSSGDTAILEVRLKKRSLQKKMEIARGRGDVAREAVVFPRAGSVLSLQPAKRLRIVTGDLNVRVNTVQPRAVDSNVARLICKIV